MTHESRVKSHLQNDAGTALVVSLMILAAMGVLGIALVFSGVSERRSTTFERDSMDALAAAESGIAVAKRAIQDMNAPLDDADNDGRPDFRMTGSLDWGGSYDVVAEAGEITGIGLTTYRSQGFTIVSEGNVRGATRRVRVELRKDSFLKFGRFVETTGTGYGCRDEINGELYVGGNLNVSTCDPGDRPEFLEHVYVTGQINNHAGAVFHQGYTEYARPIDLLNSVDFDRMRQMARGQALQNACENRGMVGFYVRLPATDPIGVRSTGDVLRLGRFNFWDMTTIPGDTIITYNGVPCDNVVTGRPIRQSEFNGIVYFERDAHVKGVMDGASAYPMTVFAGNDVYADSSIVAGHAGFDPGTGLPNSSGNPVNLGLVAYGYVYLGGVPQVTRIDAAIMAVTQNWRARNPSPAAHPPLLVGPVDLDMDGIIGETPHNHENGFGTGWDELNLTPDHWRLNLNGPVITHNGASWQPWDIDAIVNAADGPTWRYNYDMDIMMFPPPCFPDPINSWVDVSWTEIYDVEAGLWAYLP